MMRYVVAVCVLSCVGLAIDASYSDKRQLLEKSRQHAHEWVGMASETAAAPGKEAFKITPSTEVQLDGQPCEYSAVPADAEITLLEVTADRKHILRVHFTRKRK